MCYVKDVPMESSSQYFMPHWISILVDILIKYLNGTDEGSIYWVLAQLAMFHSHSHSVQNQNGCDAYSNSIITFILWDGRPWDKNKPLLDWEWRVYWLTCFNIKFDFFTIDHVCWAGENTIFKFTTPRTVSKSFIRVVVIFYYNLWSDVFISLFKITES